MGRGSKPAVRIHTKHPFRHPIDTLGERQATDLVRDMSETFNEQSGTLVRPSMSIARPRISVGWDATRWSMQIARAPLDTWCGWLHQHPPFDLTMS